MKDFLKPDRINKEAIIDGSTGKSLTFGDLHILHIHLLIR
jgi:hypothetical protein